MRILFLGDVVGKSGCLAVTKNLSDQIKKKKIDFVILNGENAGDNGVGITKKNAEEFLNKPETKEALSKLKSEYNEASKKVSKLIDEGDEILKRKVDEVLNKNKDSETVDGEEVKTEEKDVVVETETATEETVSVEEPEEVIVEVETVEVEVPKEEVVEAPVIEEPEVITRKSSEIKISEVCESVSLNSKIMEALIEEGVETYDQIEDMSDEEIVALPGIGKATLKKLRDFKY